MGDIEAPNPRMVEAKCKAEWPPRGLATEHERGPDLSPREVPYECDLKALQGTGTCEPEGKLTTLKSAAGTLLDTLRGRHGTLGGSLLERVLQTPFRGHRTEGAGIIAR
jgi:hypothetical protein